MNHGHHLVKDNNLIIFNNGQSGSSHVFDFQISSSGTFGTTTNKDFTSSGNASSSLGDVQRLPNGNTLITYSNNGVMLEVDSSWTTLQTIKGPGNSFGYADWRATLYGPPPR